MTHPESAKKWFIKASRDLRTAMALIALEDPDLEMAAFAAQQCAEKSVKGFLTFHGKRFPKTHDMKDLAELILKFETSLKSLLKDSIELTPYAIKVRYPDATDLPDISKIMAQKAIEIAQNIYNELLNKIQKKEGLEI